MTAAVKVQVEKTGDRADADGEYIIQVCPAVIRALKKQISWRSWIRQLWRSMRRQQYVIVESEHKVPGSQESKDGQTAHRKFRVIAALRRKPCSCQGNELHIAHLDMTLRDAVGVQTRKELNARPSKSPPTGLFHVAAAPETCAVNLILLDRSIRPGWPASHVGYQWEVCRVRKSFSGDMETPICRTDAGLLQNLGLPNGGLIVIEAAETAASKKKIVRRLLPVHDQQLKAALRLRQTLTEAAAEADIHAAADFDAYLGVGKDRRVPPIHMDFQTRKEMGLVPGQCVWIRRQLPTLLYTAWRRVLAAVLLTAAVFLLRQPGLTLQSGLGMTLVVLIAVIILLLFWFAIQELKDAVRSS